jgi:type I restriction enzyme S subunit
MNIDKSKWSTYRVEEFAQNISQRIDPQLTNLKVYIGLEHIDPDSLHIRQHGSPSDVEGTKLKFYKGNMIFGKRRAYQRKASLAECDGICSAHAMVLRPKETIIDKQLFPFFFHSTVFQKHAIDISVGGLSPTINWKDLAKQEFLLPPRSEQTRLAELLWAANEVVEREKEVLGDIEMYQKAYMNKKYEDIKQPEISLSELLIVNPTSKKQSDNRINASFITMSDISNEGIITNKEDKPIKEFKSKGYTVFANNDILFAKITPCMENGKGAIAKNLTNGIGFGSTEFHVLRIKNPDDMNFCFYLSKMDSFRKLAERLMTGSAGQKRVQPEFFEQYKFHAPKSNERYAIGEKMDLIENRKNDIKRQIELSQQLKLLLINKIF